MHHVLLVRGDLRVAFGLGEEHLTIGEIRLEHGQHAVLGDIARRARAGDRLLDLGDALHALHHLRGLVHHTGYGLQHQTGHTLTRTLHKSEESVRLGSLHGILVHAGDTLLQTVENAALAGRATALVILTHRQRGETVSQRACDLAHGVDQAVGGVQHQRLGALAQSTDKLQGRADETLHGLVEEGLHAATEILQKADRVTEEVEGSEDLVKLGEELLGVMHDNTLGEVLGGHKEVLTLVGIQSDLSVIEISHKGTHRIDDGLQRNEQGNRGQDGRG